MGGLNMESCLNTTEVYYKNIDDYKADINSVIENMVSKKERLVFAVVAQKSGVTPFEIRQYPDLRNYILERMVYYKEIQVINQKIEKAVNSLLKSSKSLTFISIINKCRFGIDTIYQNKYIQDKIRNVLVENKPQNKNRIS
jgi:hypothetical protein